MSHGPRIAQAGLPAASQEWRASFLLLTAGGLLLVSLLLAEVAVRLFSSVYMTPAILKQQSVAYEPALFARTVFPQAEATVQGAGVSYFINRNGYRGATFAFDKPPGTTRIAVYGGSATFDLLMPEGKDWPHRLETILRSQGFPATEVINAGVFGHAAFECFGRLYAEGHLLSPDYVLLYTAWNDIKLFRSTLPLLRTVKPYKGNPMIEYQGSLDRILSETSQLYVRLRQRYFKTRWRFHEEGLVEQGEGAQPISRAAIQQFRLTIQAFIDLSRNIGAEPILITEARLATRTASQAQKKRIGYHMQNMSDEVLYEAYENIDTVLRDVAREKAVLLIGASEALSGRDDYLADHVHLTDAGSQALAGLVAKHLNPLLTKGTVRE